MDNPFVPRFGRAGGPHPRQIAFEDGRVRLVLHEFGLADLAPEMVRRFGEKWGLGWLTFDAFFEFFPTFPVLLEAHSFDRVTGLTRPAALYRRFDETFFLRRYLDVYTRGREEAGGRPIGMVFPFDGFQGGMVVHDGRFQAWDTAIVHDLPGEGPPHRVTVEPFIPFVKYIACGGWAPDRAPTGALSAQTPKVQEGYAVRPWMTRALGCGPARDVLAFLLEVLDGPSGYYRRFVLRAGGERYVAIDHDGLARQTGLSEEQVKRGLKSLRDKGVITTRRRLHGGQMKNHILVDTAALREGPPTRAAAGFDPGGDD